MGKNETFGERIRRLRIATGLSTTQLANAVGLTEGAIRQLESGLTKTMTLVNGVRLARALGVDAGYLTFGENGDAEVQDPVLVRLGLLEQFREDYIGQQRLLAEVLIAYRDALQTLATVTKTDLQLPSLDRRAEGQ